MLSGILLALFAALLGAAFCFVGYRSFLVMLPIWGFFGGFWIGAMGTSLLLGSGFLGTTTGLVVGLVLGIIGAVFSYLFYMVGVVIIAAAFGGALDSGVLSALGFDPGLLMAIVTIVSALIAVGLTLWLNLQRYIITIYTAMAGAVLIVLAAMLVAGQLSLADLQAGGNFIEPVFQGSWFWGIVWLVLMVSGSAIQIRANRTYVFTKEMYVEGFVGYDEVALYSGASRKMPLRSRSAVTADCEAGNQSRSCFAPPGGRQARTRSSVPRPSIRYLRGGSTSWRVGARL